MPDLVRSQLNRLTARQAGLQNQISTGQKIQKPSDEPNSFVRLMDFQSETRSLKQFEENIQTLEQFSNTNYSVVDTVRKLVNRAQEMATMADDLKSPEELEIYATEVNEIINQLYRLSNTESMGQYIFGGSVTDSPPFEAVRDTDGRITSINYNGNETPADILIAAEQKAKGLIPGSNTSGTGQFGLFSDVRAESDIFKNLINLRDYLKNGDHEMVRTDSIKSLRNDESNLIYHIGAIGAEQGQMKSMAGLINEKVTALNSLSSKEADADITETILLLNQNKVAYQAALQAAGQILNTSLLDYIR
jgi:flagellar hook-associated protein 3 FlgL